MLRACTTPDEMDASLAEINPLIVTGDGRGSRSTPADFDSNALFRHLTSSPARRDEEIRPRSRRRS
jgi:succinyl-CoA synthetase beta subunit